MSRSGQPLDLNKGSQYMEKKLQTYRINLSAAVDCVRFLLRQDLSFCDHYESDESDNQENYLELYHFLTNHNDESKKSTFDNASNNMKLIAPKVQKEICSVAAAETLLAIINDIGDSYFSIIVDEFYDVSTKEQMAVVVRYVNKIGRVIERFIGVKHIPSTTATALKSALEVMFATNSLSMHRIRGQGYDGASNMRKEFHELKTLIINDNPQAFYIHCFAHQLQLCLVAVSKNHSLVKNLFECATKIMNTIGAPCKRNDPLKAIQHDKILLHLRKGELISGRGLNQETILQITSDTCGGSHYYTLISLMKMYASVIEVLEIIKEDGIDDHQSVEAGVLIDAMETFDFVFVMHLMINILGITNELSQSLQRKDQDIQNAMKLVQVSKQRLQMMRDNGWASLLDEVTYFCNVFQINIPNMDCTFKPRRRSIRRAENITNLHYYHVKLFCTTIDMQLEELNNRFSEASTELLLCLACLNPSDSFSAFDKGKLIRLAELYPSDFTITELTVLENQLSTYIIDMCTSDKFSSLCGIADLAEAMVKFKRSIMYPLVYKLITLALTLPIAAATVERAFSAMKIVKNRLCNKTGDEWLDDCLIPYIEKDVFDLVPNEVVIQHYQKIQNIVKNL